MSKNRTQLNLLNKTLNIARNSKFYKSKLQGFPLELKNILELQNFPFTTKKELRDCYPFGALAVPINDVVELHTSSGTTGKAALSFLTKEDLKNSSKAIAKAWKCFGITKSSRVQFMMSYGLFSGATLNTYAIQELGGFVVPAGIQSAEKQIPLEQFSLKCGIMAGEIYSDKVRSEIERKFKIKIFDHYGLCEVNTGIAYECELRTGLHFLHNYVIKYFYLKL